jgi:pyridoxal phosphate enzyme (YggS family)
MIKFLPMTANEISEKLASVRERIAHAAARAERHPSDVMLIAVTKTQPVETIREAIAAGLTTLGENRVQEWESKRADFSGDPVRCHLIGHLQSNKARKAAAIFDRVDSLDSVPLAQKLDAAAAEEGNRLGVLIEVHLGDELSKSGVAESDLDSLTNAVRGFTNLKLEGLMAVPPYFENLEQVRPYFRRLRELRERLRARTGLPLPVLSMGMSHDFEVAIEEGATEVRLGSALFGERPKKA